jgi:hypothetical protein
MNGSYSGTYASSDARSGAAQFTVSSGGRATANLTENGSGKTGLFAGRISGNEITGSTIMQGDGSEGFTGTVERGAGSLLLHLTYHGTGTTATYTLAKG